jgi:hypothetical protein
MTMASKKLPRSEIEPQLPKGWMTGFEPAIPRSTISGSDDVKARQSTHLRISDSEFAHPVPTDTCNSDPELREIMDAWNEPPEPVRASLLMLVRAARKGATK